MRYQKRYELGGNPPVVIPVTLSEMLTGCTSSVTGKTFVKGETTNIVLTADSGKYFEDQATSVTISLDGIAQTGIVYDEGGFTATLNNLKLDCTTLSIVATAVDVLPLVVHVEVNAEHIVPCDFGGIAEGDELNSTYEAFTVTPEEGYIIAGTPTIVMGEKTVSAVVAEGGVSATFEGGILTDENVVITVETEVFVAPEEPPVVREIEEIEEVVKRPKRKAPVKKQEA